MNRIRLRYNNINVFNNNYYNIYRSSVSSSYRSYIINHNISNKYNVHSNIYNNIDKYRSFTTTINNNQQNMNTISAYKLPLLYQSNLIICNNNVLNQNCNSNQITRSIITSSVNDNTNNNITNNSKEFYKSKGISIWLFLCCGIVITIVILGGATRLTRSGLSMVEWKFHGTLPPMNDDEWQKQFELYQQYPEFKRVNFDMSLDEFKFIFWMEYCHRMAGRLAGIVFILPLIGFAMRGQINGILRKRVSILFAMGATQGLIGWWMVKSGLNEDQNTNLKEPSVSPYRLATHLSSAFIIYCTLLDTALKTWPTKSSNSLLYRPQTGYKAIGGPLRIRAILLTKLVFLTVIAGAFVAGNKAGWIYNEFPKMGGLWIPSDIIDPYIYPKWRNIFENPTMVQFNHRVLAITSTTVVTLFWFYGRRRMIHLTRASKVALNTTMILTCGQLGLGIATLLMFVPTSLGVAHQFGALSVLSSFIWLLHTLGPKPIAVANSMLLIALISSASISIDNDADKVDDKDDNKDDNVDSDDSELRIAKKSTKIEIVEITSE